MTRRIMFVVLSVVFVASSGGTEDFTIFQRNKGLSMSQIDIHVGDQITFVNEDDVSHSLYAETPGSDFETLQRPGQPFTRRFLQPGVVIVRCAIHPGMKLTVRVRKKEP